MNMTGLGELKKLNQYSTASNLHILNVLNYLKDPEMAISGLVDFLSHPDDDLRRTATLFIIYRCPTLKLEKFQEKTTNTSFAPPNFRLFFENEKEIINQSIYRHVSQIKDDKKRLGVFLEALLAFNGYYYEINNIFQSQNLMDCKNQFEHLVKEKRKYRYRRQLMLALTYECNIQCSYCYAINMKKGAPPFLKIEDFKKVLDWGLKQELEFISFTGGEPTVHPYFTEIVKLLENKPISCYFSTNNLFSDEILQALYSEKIVNINVHINNREFYTEDKLKIFISNMANLKGRDKDIYFRYNLLDKEEKNWEFVFNLADEFSIKQINFALPFPNQDRSNNHVSSQELRQYGKAIIKFVRQCATKDIRARLAKPLPFCMFNHDEVKELILCESLIPICTVTQNHYTYNLVVNPDLSVMPCIALDFNLTKKLTDFSSLESIGEYYSHYVDKYQKREFFPECHTCGLYYTYQCQGACLSYKS